MGDLSVTVRLNGVVVDERVVPVTRVVRLGEAPDAAVSFPGADLGVLRVGNRLRLRGHLLDEGDELVLALGVVQVHLEHTARARLPGALEGVWDSRLLAAMALVMAAGSWWDAAAGWLRAHGELSQVTAPVQRAGAVGGSDLAELPPAPAETAGLPDGPPHQGDDARSGTGWHRWFRRSLPSAEAQRAAAEERLAAQPEDPAAQRLLAREAYDRGDADEAARRYRALLERSAQDRDARLRLAWAQMRLGYHRGEIAHYRSLLDGDPDHVVALAGLAVALTRINRLDEAAVALEELLSVDPDGPWTALAMAKITALQGDDRAALEQLDRAYGAREQLSRELQLELRRDIATDPAFASLRRDTRLRSLVNRHLGAAGPRRAR